MRLPSSAGSSASISSQQRLQFFRFRPAQRDTAGHAVPHGAVQRQIGGRAADRVAGAVVDHARRRSRPGAWPGREAQGPPGTDRRTRLATGRSGNRPRPPRPGCLPIRCRRRRWVAAGWYRRRCTPCCRAAGDRGCRRCELRRNEGSCTPCAGRTTSPPSSASLMLRLPALSCTAFRICDFARRMKRWRLARFFPLGFRRRSTMCIGCLSDLSGNRRAS